MRRILGPNTNVASFPGHGAATITHYLHSIRFDAHAIVVVWFLNEFFPTRWKLADQYPAGMDALAEGLAEVLRSFPYRAAIIGGGAHLWNVPERFDIWAERVRSIVSRQGICVVSGLDVYSSCELADDHWHLRSTPRNKAMLASYVANLVWQMVS